MNEADNIYIYMYIAHGSLLGHPAKEVARKHLRRGLLDATPDGLSEAAFGRA